MSVEFCPRKPLEPCDLKLLAIASGENLELGSDRGLVVVEPFKREAQPMILIRAFILE